MSHMWKEVIWLKKKSHEQGKWGRKGAYGGGGGCVWWEFLFRTEEKRFVKRKSCDFFVSFFNSFVRFSYFCKYFSINNCYVIYRINSDSTLLTFNSAYKLPNSLHEGKFIVILLLEGQKPASTENKTRIEDEEGKTISSRVYLYVHLQDLRFPSFSSSLRPCELSGRGPWPSELALHAHVCVRTRMCVCTCVRKKDAMVEAKLPSCTEKKGLGGGGSGHVSLHKIWVLKSHKVKERKLCVSRRGKEVKRLNKRRRKTWSF